MMGTCTAVAGLDFADALTAMISAQRRTPLIVGIAIGPAAETLLRRECAESADCSFASVFGGVPLLVDPRMPIDQSEVYYDREAWNKRCREQRIWDAKRIPN